MLSQRLRVMSILPIFAFVLNCSADEIELKNGVLISADSVKEQGAEVIYQIGAASYRIPRVFVLRVIRNDNLKLSTGRKAEMEVTIRAPKTNEWVRSATAEIAPAVANPRRSQRELLAINAPSTNVSAEEKALIDQVITNREVNEEALEEIEKKGVSLSSAVANLVAAKFEMEEGDASKAPTHVERALKFSPNEPVLYGWYAAALAKAGKPEEALEAAKRYAEHAPKSAEAFGLLGSLYYNLDKTKEAVEAWKRALDIDPNSPVKKVLDRAQKDLDTEEAFNEQQSTHFSVRYDGGKVSADLQRQLLAALESAYTDLAQELRYTPSQPITVILYGNKTFFDVTEAPAWAGGLNDGRVRVPVEGVQRMTPVLQGVLRHELVHSFVAQMTQGRCTAWLHEGLAQLLEPDSALSHRQILSALFQKNGLVPLGDLEENFGSLDAAQARIAYLESLLAVEYLRSKYGMKDVLGMLEGIARGQSTEESLKSRTRIDYTQLEADLTALVTADSRAPGVGH
jgi:tetratricopeptide (TPR) repeat protein